MSYNIVYKDVRVVKHWWGKSFHFNFKKQLIEKLEYNIRIVVYQLSLLLSKNTHTCCFYINIIFLYNEQHDCFLHDGTLKMLICSLVPIVVAHMLNNMALASLVTPFPILLVYKVIFSDHYTFFVVANTHCYNW